MQQNYAKRSYKTISYKPELPRQQWKATKTESKDGNTNTFILCQSLCSNKSNIE